MNKTPLLLVVFAVSTLAAGCNKSGENAKTSAQVPAEYNYAYDKREVYLTNASADLTALDQKINELAGKAAAAGEAVKTNAQPKLQELRNQRAALNQKLDALKKASEANWNDTKSDYMKSYNEAKNSCQQAWQWLAEKVGS